jgi:hypothetical protein
MLMYLSFCDIDKPVAASTGAVSGARSVKPKPRRWVVEFHGAALDAPWNYLENFNRSGTVIREVKPITRAQVTAALSPHYAEVTSERIKYINFLRNLGIEVED